MIDRLAVVGATGAVGRIVRELLERRGFPAKEFVFLASSRSAGGELTFSGRRHPIRLLEASAFQGVDLCIASTPDDVAKEFVPWAVAAGCTVIDESGAWRMDPSVPLVVPEVNSHAIAAHQGILASPNCSTTQLVVALKPLHDAARVRRVVVSTYQATSGAGVAGEADLIAGTKAALAGEPYSYTAFKHPIAFNLIPQIGSEKEGGYTSEEMKMVHETRKILGDSTIKISATCVRVPVSNCHSESVWVETERKLTADEARQLFRDFPGITLLDDLPTAGYPMPRHCDGLDDVWIGRVREDLSCERGLTFWCVSDNLRKGAATNAVQIAEHLVSERVLAK